MGISTGVFEHEGFEKAAIEGKELPRRETVSYDN
jgi:hypothetical protein